MAVAAMAALLAGCGGAPGAVAPPDGGGVPVAQAPAMVSDAATMPDPAAPTAAGTVAPALAPIVVHPSGAQAAAAASTAVPAAPATTDPAVPSTTDPAAPATTDPAVPATTDPAAPATTDPAPAQRDTTDPAPASTDPPPATTDPAPATTDPAPVGEVNPDLSGRPAAPAIATDDGMSALIEGGDNGRKEVALTFDAGADTGYAPVILDLLRDEGIHATFGMTGAWAENNPDLIKRMVAEGHQLINHTYSHDSLTGANTGKPEMTYEQLADELSRTETIVRDLADYELKPYFRPPYGDYDATTLTWLKDLGYPYTVMWTCDTRGWAGWDASKILDYCTSVPMEDDIILMHVGASAAGDYEALPRLIAWYRDNGYAFVTVEQMLQP